MSLSKFDRLLLIQLLELRQEINSNNDFREGIEALSSGYSGFYPMFDYIADELPNEVKDYVFDTLEMYDWCQHVLREADGSVPREALFPGFDGNARVGPEGAYGFAVFLVETAHRYSSIEYAGDRLNSHGSEPDYRAMVATWKADPINRATFGEPTPEQIDLARRTLVRVRP